MISINTQRNDRLSGVRLPPTYVIKEMNESISDITIDEEGKNSMQHNYTISL